METKAKINQLVSEVGIIRILDIDGEDYLRVVVEGAGATNTLQVSVRLKGQADYVLVKEIVGPANEKVKVSTYEEVKVECTVIDATDVAIKVIVSSFNEASGSAIEIDVPAGESISDIEVLTFTSSDSSVVISGNNTTKAIDLKVNLNLDDVQEYPSLLDFPAVGQINTLYVALDTELVYRFSGSIYIEVSPSAVRSVNTRTGDITLDKSDVGLSNVDNTSDANKPVSTATQSALDLKQDALGFTPENVVNKSTDTTLGTSDTLYPSQNAVKVYVDNSVASGSAPDATTSSKGIIQLAGDLGGTAAAPTVPALANKYDASNPAGYITLAEVPADAVSSVNTKTGDVVLDKSDIGLSNVDNTSDASKPVSTATQNALDLKYDASNPAGYITLAEVPAALVTSVNTKTGDVVLDKSDIGLSNVDNTSDLNKPISTATQNALDLKQNSLGFTPENVSNKSDDSSLGTSSTLYPTQKAVKEYVDNSIASGAAPDATTTTKGIVKLAGDLSGTADAPTVPGLASKYDASNPAGYITLAEVPADAVTSVNTKVGAVVIDKTDIGLSNVDNTSDANKPISTATQNALDLKYDASNPAGYITLAQVPSASDATTTSKGIIQLAGDLAGTADAPTVPGLASKQDTLVSGTNIKTINGSSVLGSGDLVISGGVTSHSALSNLENDDHLQYHTDARGDARYYTKTEIDTSLSAKVENAANLGSGEGVFSAKDGTTLQLKSLVAGTNVSITSDATSITINSSGGSTVSDATTTTKGIIQLAGDLAGTADAPTVPGLASKYDASNPAGYITLAEVPADAVTSVNGQTGVVVIDAINEARTLTADVFNNTGNPIPKMTVVYINGGQGDMPTVALAQANSESSSSKTFAVTAELIDNMLLGKAVVSGALKGLDTTVFGAIEGTTLYLSPTVAGEITTTKPVAPNHMVVIGKLVRVHQNEGVIEVSIQNGYEFDELHNVLISGVADGQVVAYEDATSLWKNKTLTKSDVGLSDVDNTSDADKPISSATQTALNAKQDSLGFTPENVTNKSTDTSLGTSDILYPTQNAVKTYVDNSIASGSAPDATTTTKGIVKLAGDLGGTADLPTVPGLASKYDASNPAGYITLLEVPVTTVNSQTGDVVLNKSDVGLSNVDNTSDADKPVSSATLTALNGKANVSLNNLTSADIPSGVNLISSNSSGALFSVKSIDSTGNTSSSSFQSGNNLDLTTGGSGYAELSSGYSATTSGSVYVESGKSRLGVSGNVEIITGNINTLGLINNSTNTSTTGNIILASGQIINTSNANRSGQVSIRTGSSTSTAGTGFVTVGSGTHSGTAGNSGQSVFQSGNATASGGSSGLVALISGNVSAGSGTSGTVLVRSGTTVNGNTGQVDVQSNSPSGTGSSGIVRVFSGNSVSGSTGAILVASGSSTSGGATGSINLQTGTTSGTRGDVLITAPNLNIQNNKIINTGEFYFGDPNTDGTYRIRPDGDNLVTERREGGVYVVKQTITP